MSRVLLAAHPTVGHTNALRAIGIRLREQGHQVAFSLTVALSLRRSPARANARGAAPA